MRANLLQTFCKARTALQLLPNAWQREQLLLEHPSHSIQAISFRPCDERLQRSNKFLQETCRFGSFSGYFQTDLPPCRQHGARPNTKTTQPHDPFLVVVLDIILEWESFASAPQCFRYCALIAQCGSVLTCPATCSSCASQTQHSSHSGAHSRQGRSARPARSPAWCLTEPLDGAVHASAGASTRAGVGNGYVFRKLR